MERIRSGNWASRLRRILTVAQEEHCDFCSKPIDPLHTHLIERVTRKFFCACPQCTLLLGEGERFAIVNPRIHPLHNFELNDAEWQGYYIPIDLAFIFRSTPAQRQLAIYPGPAGAIEAYFADDAWARLIEANPVLTDLHPDVEALLVNRMNGAREYYLVSIDRCYALIGVMRKHWRGLSGGAEVWESVQDYFQKLRDGVEMSEAAHG